MIYMYMNLYFLHVTCTATSGVPPSPASGFVDFTNVIEGSLATFRCAEMTAVCRASGEWVPNPRDLNCDGTDAGRPSIAFGSKSRANLHPIYLILTTKCLAYESLF